MSQEAQKYVLSLGSRVSRRQHHFLLVLAFHHQANRETFWPSRETLAEEARTDRTEIRRMVKECEELGIVRFTPGLGRGNKGSYEFVELEKGVKTGVYVPPFAAVKGGIKGGKIGTPYKEDTNYKIKVVKPDGLDLGLESADRIEKRSEIVSSSSVNADDDTSKLSRIAEAFEQNPITSGKMTAADIATARRLLENFTVEQIEFGILLGSARKANTISNQLQGDPITASGDVSGKVRSLQYFREVIEEAAALKLSYGADYARYLQHVLRRCDLKKQPQKAAAG
jgi:hypothetical protein